LWLLPVHLYRASVISPFVGFILSLTNLRDDKNRRARRRGYFDRITAQIDAGWPRAQKSSTNLG